MALAECYLPAAQPSVRRHVAHAHSRATTLACPPPAPAPNPAALHTHAHNAWSAPHQQIKDYSRPLHVDCSVEYELPECAKPPQGVAVEPLLMIHPAHFRRLDSLRRCPFVNNLPAASSGEFELPPPQHINGTRRACRRSTQQPSPERSRTRWSTGVAACCRPLAAAVGAAPPPPDLVAPKEGDTLETSTIANKYVAPRYKRTCRPHPYAPLLVEPPPSHNTHDAHKDTHLPPDCDKTFDALQGNPLISPFHAKMFTSDSVYQNYPIVMYK